MIIFNSKKTEEIIRYSSQPVFNLVRVEFLSEEENWVSRLVASRLIVKIICLDNAEKIIASSEDSLSFGGYITPQHVEPILEVNRYFKFSREEHLKQNRYTSNWAVDLILSNLTLHPKESLKIEFIDSKHIEDRVDDWETRIKNVIEDVTKWTSIKKNIEVKFARKERMHERLMKDFDVEMREIPSANILKDGKIVVAIKPFGLWIIGANGRIDLLTSNGNSVLIDQSEQFQKSKWRLFSQSDRSKGVDFNKDVLFQILGV